MKPSQRPARLSLLTTLVTLAFVPCAQAQDTSPKTHNVIWDSPSKNHTGSMPLGNGDISLNAWVEPSGDLVFFIGKSDSWGDNARLLKLGKVRVKLDPAPAVTPFLQELSLESGTMHVRLGDGTTLRLWADANHPTVHVDVQSQKAVTATASVELWRTKKLTLSEVECSDVMMDRAKPRNMHAPTVVEPDTIIPALTNRIGWYHHNIKSVGPAQHAETQGMTGYKRQDPLLHRTFGAVITADQGKRLDDTHLQSAAAQSHHFSVHVLTRHPSTPEAWLRDIQAQIASTEKSPLAERRTAHEQWWSSFWQRSWIHASNNPGMKQDQASSPADNKHPLRVGVDQAGGNKFSGAIRNTRIPKSFALPFTLEAEVNPAKGEKGRIFDKITPGGNDGFLLDTHPGNSLRLIVGDKQFNAKGVLPAGKWAKVTTRATASGWTVSVDGKQVIDTSHANSDDAAYVSRMYALQRFITACAGRGAYPIKFNGSLFTVPYGNKPGDADYRRWGPGYWWQNTRLPYLGLCASGDMEMLEPLFRMYVDDILPYNKHRTKEYFGLENAAYYAECIHFWGDVFNESYGWKPQSERKDPLQESRYHKWEWVAGPELVWMMLDAYDHSGDEKLLQQRILPTAVAVVRFFDGYYKTNTDGQLVMHPSQALETWWDCTNPMPELAGLRAIIPRLLALPSDSVPAATRAELKSFLAKLAPLPVRDTPDGKALAPATICKDKRNVENPELYAVFPFRLCSFEKDNRQLGINALKHRWDRGNSGWRQDDLFMTYLGQTELARKNLVARARQNDKNSRFPAFWGPNYDWVPDQDHGGVLTRTFQTMLMQSEGDQIYLLPAWPKDWDVNFKLHAPHNTTVEGVYKNGKLEKLTVTPESRRKDVRIVAGGA